MQAKIIASELYDLHDINTMSSIPELLATLKATLNELEHALDVQAGRGRKIAIIAKQSSSYSGPTGGIRRLLDDGFFSQPKSLTEVINALMKEGYHFRKETISTSLIRLVRQRVLTRVESKKDSREKWNYAKRK